MGYRLRLLTFGTCFSQNDHRHISRLSQRLHEKILERCTNIIRNGDPEGYPGCLNLSFEYIEGESLLMAMKDVALSSGSACTSASLEPSYVLRALGASDENAHSSLRFGIGRFTTEGEVDYVADKIAAVVNREFAAGYSFALHTEADAASHPRAARLEPSLGDGARGHRHQDDQLGSALIAVLLYIARLALYNSALASRFCNESHRFILAAFYSYSDTGPEERSQIYRMRMKRNKPDAWEGSGGRHAWI